MPAHDVPAAALAHFALAADAVASDPADAVPVAPATPDSPAASAASSAVHRGVYLWLSVNVFP